MSTSRERDIRRDIADRLIATGAYDPAQVFLTAWNNTPGTMESPIITIEPRKTGMTSAGVMSSGAGSRGALGYDGPLDADLLFTGEALVGVQSYVANTEDRDDEMELVLANLANAVNGQSLADMTLPADTVVSGWKWQDLTQTQPRILWITVRYVFMTDGWEGFGTTP